MGKLSVGAAAAATGTALFSRPAQAATALHCCEGIACGFHGCLHGMVLGYTWSCGGYFCHDCFTHLGNGSYFCTYTVARASTRHSTNRRAATTTYYTPPEYYAPPADYSFFGPPSDYFGD
ncbi:MAG TPA: hypothetical protein VF120_16135 [Ktedonobacterales bacterium]